MTWRRRVAQAGRRPWGERPVAATIFVAIVILLPLVAYLATRPVFPSDGVQVLPDIVGTNSTGLTVRPIQESGPLHAGDLVVAVDGHSTDELFERIFGGRGSPLSTAARTLTYTVVRDGARLDVAVPLLRMPLLAAIAHDWSLYLFLVCLAGLGVFVFLHRPRVLSAQVFFLLSMAAVSAEIPPFLSFQVSDLGHPWFIVFLIGTHTILWFLVLSMALHLALIFPRVRPALARRPRAVVFVYLAPWLLYALLLARPSLGGLTPTELFQANWRATYLVGVAFFVLILGAVLTGLRQRLVGSEQRQQRWVVWGVAIGYLPWLALFFLASFAGVADLRAFSPLVGLWLLAIPTTMAIAIVRERLFDIDLIVNRTLVYGSLSAILAALYAASVALSQRIITAITGEQSDLAVVLATLVIVAAFTPIKDWLQRAVDRRYKGLPDSAQRLRAFGEQVRSRVGAVDPTQVTRRSLEEAVEALGASGGAAYLDSGGRRRLVSRIGAAPTDDALTIPFVDRNGESVGALVLGPGNDGLPYGEPELATLREVAALVGMAIETDAPAVEPRHPSRVAPSATSMNAEDP